MAKPAAEQPGTRSWREKAGEGRPRPQHPRRPRARGAAGLAAVIATRNHSQRPVERSKHPPAPWSANSRYKALSVASGAISGPAARNQSTQEPLTRPKPPKNQSLRPSRTPRTPHAHPVPSLPRDESDPPGSTHLWQMFISDFLGTAAAVGPPCRGAGLVVDEGCVVRVGWVGGGSLGSPGGRNSLRSCGEKSSPGDPPGTPEISDLASFATLNTPEGNPRAQNTPVQG